MGSINIRGAKIWIAPSTATAGTSSLTAVANVVEIQSLPETGGFRRNATELASTTEVYLGGKLKTLAGELAYTVHQQSTGAHTDYSGENHHVFVDIPVGINTSATTQTSYVQIVMQAQFSRDRIVPGDDESEVLHEVAAEPMIAPIFRTASY